MKSFDKVYEINIYSLELSINIFKLIYGSYHITFTNYGISQLKTIHCHFNRLLLLNLVKVPCILLQLKYCYSLLALLYKHFKYLLYKYNGVFTNIKYYLLEIKIYLISNNYVISIVITTTI